jgi:hypothetical protein
VEKNSQVFRVSINIASICLRKVSETCSERSVCVCGGGGGAKDKKGRNVFLHYFVYICCPYSEDHLFIRQIFKLACDVSETEIFHC